MTTFSLFDTSIGNCAIAWTELGICALLLPEQTDDQTIEKLMARFPGSVRRSPDSATAEAIKMVVRHLSGELQDLSTIKLDLADCSAFAQKVYSAAREVPAGSINTYGELASQINATGAARAVGGALGTNPVALIVPCHRIVGKGSRLTGFSAFGGCDLKMRLLSIEGALTSDFRAIPSDLA